jgi:hypothetical protein
LKNSILAGNRTETGVGRECDGEIISLGYSLIGDTNGCTYNPGVGDLANLDASLGPLVGLPGKPKYHPLLPTSPAIDAGDPSGCTDFQGNLLETDQREAARVGRCDIGAYEYTPPGSPAGIFAYAGAPQSTLPSQAFLEPLQALALDSIGSPVGGITLTFSAPASSASGIFDASGTYTTTAVTQQDGLAAVGLTANSLTGVYTVTASASGVISPADFPLRNIGWYVAPGGDDGNDCLSPGAPCASIDGATGKTGFGAGDTVLVASGTYTKTGEQVVTILEDVRLLGGWDSSFTVQEGAAVIDGQSSRRGIWIAESIKAFIERFSIQNGLVSDDSGGGLYLDDYSTLDLLESAVISNTAASGGGIYHGRATILNLWDSTVRDNIASTGAGGGICTWGRLDIDRSTIVGNLAVLGGSVYASSSAIKMSNTLLVGNAASTYGGGIYAGFSVVAIENILFSVNRAMDGGGMYSRYADSALSNVTLSANQASGAGGALYNDHSSIQVFNTVLWGNQAPSGEQVYNDESSAPTFSYGLAQGGCPEFSACDHLLDSEPRFVRPASAGADSVWGTLDDDYGDLRLASGSPAIDAGDNDAAPGESLDLDGKPRFFDVPNELDTGNGTPPVIDMGAYETNRASTAVTITAHLPEPSLAGQPVTVTFIIQSLPPVAGTPTGMVTVSGGDGDECTALVAEGQCTLVFGSAGYKTLMATYSGDENYNVSSASKSHQVYYGVFFPVIWNSEVDPGNGD